MLSKTEIKLSFKNWYVTEVKIDQYYINKLLPKFQTNSRQIILFVFYTI